MVTHLPISRALRGTRRTRDILSVMMRFGFDSVVQDLNLDQLLLKGRKLVGVEKADASVHRERPEVRIRHAMEELGPTFVKLGQVLSVRPDLVPPGWAEEFGRLQDDVPRVDWKDIRAALEAEYDKPLDEMFRSVSEEPIAAASIAQVHRAVMPDGREIVLKVLRPGIRDVVEADLYILARLAEFAEEHFSNLGYSPTRVVEQFATQLGEELNLVEEGRSTDRMRRAFADDEHVGFPEVIWEATTASVLALEEIKGKRLSRLDPATMPVEELEAIVAHGTDAVFRQCLEIGFFHADPHPGNIIVQPGGRVVFIDCGMTGRIDPGTALVLADLVYGVINGDLDRVIDVTILLGDADPTLAEDRNFRADTWEFISRFRDASFDQLDMGKLLNDFFERVRRHHLQCPADIVFLIKAISTIEGVGERLLPSFDIAAHVEPHVERLVKRRYGLSSVRRRVQETWLGYAELLERLPRQFRSLVFNLRRNRFTVNLEHRGLDRLTETIDHASANIAHAVFIGSLMMGSSILILADSSQGGYGVLAVLGGLGFGISLVLVIGRLVRNFFR